MNTSSNIKRWIVLLDKAPFILFLESANYLPHADYIVPALEKFNLSFTDAYQTINVEANQDLRRIISATNKLPDPIAYAIIEALMNNLPKDSRILITSNWQQDIKWQNVDVEPTPNVKEYSIIIYKFTHKIFVMGTEDSIDESNMDGKIHLDNIDPSVPFPLQLLKDCVIEIHDIITATVIGRHFSEITESKYTSIMQTGHDTFHYINMRKIENDLKAAIIRAGITIEE